MFNTAYVNAINLKYIYILIILMYEYNIIIINEERKKIYTTYLNLIRIQLINIIDFDYLI